MINLLLSIYNIFNSYSFLLAAVSISFVIKTYLLAKTILYGLRTPRSQRPWVFLVPILIGAMISDIAWIASMSSRLFFIGSDYRFPLFFIRLAWATTIIQYQCMGLFLENLIDKDYKLRFHQKIFIPITTIFSGTFLYLLIFHFNNAQNRPLFEFKLFSAGSIYTLLLVIPSLYLALEKARSNQVPKILTKQFKIVVYFLIIPYVFLDFIQSFQCSFAPGFVASNLAIVSFGTILLTLAFYLVAQKIMGLRFLNFQEHVQTKPYFNFIDDFKLFLDQLSYAITKQELTNITSLFFKQAFKIPANRTTLIIRRINTVQTVKKFGDYNDYYPLFDITELFLASIENNSSDVAAYLAKKQIVIADEVAFNNFYENSECGKMLLHFMDQIGADIFIPIYQKEAVIAYIIVDRNSRPHEFYSRTECDEMVVFANYLSNVVHLMQHSNLPAILKERKELKEEMYHKHQEINQYKESIQSFVRSAHRKIGIIFYKNRRFDFSNQTAKDLIPINPNTHDGHPVTKALKSIVHYAQEYKNAQSAFITDPIGDKLVIVAHPHLQDNIVIITVYYPEIGDLLKNQCELIKDPSEWDYLLYLETTQTGKLINQLIPTSSPQFLQFKITLLKLALSKKTLLLDMPEEDVQPTAEILHSISLREKLHILNLTAPEKSGEIAHKIFGLNQLFGGTNELPLLEQLDENGTLLIKNIHFLDVTTQSYLAEYIKYGFFRRLKGDQKFTSSTRILCSSNESLSNLVSNGTFSAELLALLEQTTLALPSLVGLPEHELSELVHGFSEQAIKAEQFKNMLELTEQETHRIVFSRPQSLQKFKEKIEQFLVHKTKKNNISEESPLDPGFTVSDPELALAARLGKKALKDPKLMATLWQKFGNHNQIAQFLGVNRSTVHRRFKLYNLKTEVN